MESARQVEICQEARFVLWALRCALAAARGEVKSEAAAAELRLGFELADVSETTTAFQRFAAVLCAVDWPQTVWHHPRCGCVSTEEMCVLQALAETALRQRNGAAGHSHWWRLLLPVEAVAAVEGAACAWLTLLYRAGVVFPTPDELTDCLRPLEAMAGPASARVH